MQLKNNRFKMLLLISLALNLFFIGYYFIHISNNLSKDIGPFSIVILGDSRVSRVQWNTLLNRKDIYNSGIAGIKINDCNNELDSLLQNFNCKEMFIQIGINDIRANEKADTIFFRYKKLISKMMNSHLKFYVTSVIPIRKDFVQDSVSESQINDNVDSLNIFLESYCKNFKVSFIKLKGLSENKRLKLNYTSDGIHLNDSGNFIFANQIRPYLNAKN